MLTQLLCNNEISDEIRSHLNNNKFWREVGEKCELSSRYYCEENILSYCAMIICQVKILREKSSCTKSKVNPILIRWICSHSQNCRTILSAIYALTWPLLQPYQIGFLPNLCPEEETFWFRTKSWNLFQVRQSGTEPKRFFPWTQVRWKTYFL